MDWRMLSPLVLATMASQSLLVVLSPRLVAIADDLDASIAVVGQARSVTAAVSIVTSLVIIARGARASVPTLLATGGVTTLLGCAAVASASSVATFLVAHVVVGLGFALLLSGGFAGIAAFPHERRGWRAAQAVPAAMGVAALVSAP